MEFPERWSIQLDANPVRKDALHLFKIFPRNDIVASTPSKYTHSPWPFSFREQRFLGVVSPCPSPFPSPCPSPCAPRAPHEGPKLLNLDLFFILVWYPIMQRGCKEAEFFTNVPLYLPLRVPTCVLNTLSETLPWCWSKCVSFLRSSFNPSLLLSICEWFSAINLFRSVVLSWCWFWLPQLYFFFHWYWSFELRFRSLLFITSFPLSFEHVAARMGCCKSKYSTLPPVSFAQAPHCFYIRMHTNGNQWIFCSLQFFLRVSTIKSHFFVRIKVIWIGRAPIRSPPSTFDSTASMSAGLMTLFTIDGIGMDTANWLPVIRIFFWPPSVGFFLGSTLTFKKTTG